MTTITNSKLTDETLSAWKTEAKISLGETARDSVEYSHHEAILSLVTEIQEHRKAAAEPVLYVMGMGCAFDAETASTCKGAVDSWVGEWNQERLPGQEEYKTVPLYTAPPAPDNKQTDELVMWVKRLSHSLRNARPDSELHGAAMDYLSRKGLISVEDVLR